MFTWPTFYQEKRIPVQVAEKLSELVKEGVPVLFVGQIPGEEIGYLDYRARSRRIAQIMASLRGRVRSAKTVPDAMAALPASLQPNVRFLAPADGVSFIQKKVGQVNIYFLRNGNASPANLEAEFHEGGASPETWDPWTGNTAPVANFRRTGEVVRVPLELEPYGSRVIVFDPADRHAPTSVHREGLPPVPVGASGWTLDIAGRESMKLTALVDWSRLATLRHFSGKARYSTTFRLDTPGNRLELDLGEVKDVAEIRVNGRKGPVLLCRPYRADITSLVQPGANTLEVIVTNSLFNRLSGAGMRLTATPGESLPAGLLGPVRLQAWR
ncbi:MAG: hypothetical protein M1436_06665 [Acidobacteria bacterium]|nr:hypothetical protein [Acidobacteriota bacterium]